MNIGMPPAGGQKVLYGGDKADNLNPQAPDCYFYYYSSCSKVRAEKWFGVVSCHTHVPLFTHSFLLSPLPSHFHITSSLRPLSSPLSFSPLSFLLPSLPFLPPHSHPLPLSVSHTLPFSLPWPPLPSFSPSPAPPPPSRVISASSVTARLLWGQRRSVTCGCREVSVGDKSAPSDTLYLRSVQLYSVMVGNPSNYDPIIESSSEPPLTLELKTPF